MWGVHVWNRLFILWFFFSTPLFFLINIDGHFIEWVYSKQWMRNLECIKRICQRKIYIDYVYVCVCANIWKEIITFHGFRQTREARYHCRQCRMGFQTSPTTWNCIVHIVCIVSTIWICYMYTSSNTLRLCFCYNSIWWNQSCVLCFIYTYKFNYEMNYILG